MSHEDDRAKRLQRLEAIQDLRDDDDVWVRTETRDARKEAWAEARAAQAAYDLAHPPLERAREAAEALELKLCALSADQRALFPGVVAAMETDLAGLRAQYEPRPKQVAPTPALRRKPWTRGELEMEAAGDSELAKVGDRIATLDEMNALEEEHELAESFAAEAIADERRMRIQ